MFFFFFKQKTAYEMRISDWSSDVCSSDLFQKTGEEKLTDVEVGAKTDFRLGNGRGRFNIAAFYTSYKNALQFLNAQNVGLPFTTPDQPTNGSVAANIADLEIWGIELETSVSPVRDVTVSLDRKSTRLNSSH